MVYDVHTIAEWFLLKSPMTHKKLQKLCYYAQAWSYALLDEPLIQQDFEAWMHGPVCPALYDAYKGSGWKNLYPSDVVNVDAKTLELLESVYATYGDSSGNALEALTHTEPPWINARKGCSPHENCSNKIHPRDMKEYYRSIYEGGEE